MQWAIALPVFFFLAGLVWAIVLVLYSRFVEPIACGPRWTFAVKSALLLFVVALVVTFLPLGGMAALLVWWIGLMVIFKKEIWECQTLVLMVWGTNFLISIVLRALFAGR